MCEAFVSSTEVEFKSYPTKKGILVQGFYQGIPVYRHRGYEDEIFPGHTYLCELRLNMSDCGNYFAIPLKEVFCPDVHEEPVVQETGGERDPEAVYRISEDELESDLFHDGFYLVTVSPNGKRMVLEPYGKASNRCTNGRLRLAGLASYMPYVPNQRFTVTVKNKHILLSL